MNKHLFLLLFVRLFHYLYVDLFPIVASATTQSGVLWNNFLERDICELLKFC